MHHTRTYSISSAPGRDDECITITVKAATGGRVSQHLVRNVVPGDYLPLGLPQGDFVLPDAVPLRPLFITAGSGITPVMSMLRDHAARGDLPSIVHLHYAPHPYDVIFAKELAKLRDDHRRYRLRLVYTRERPRRLRLRPTESPRRRRGALAGGRSLASPAPRTVPRPVGRSPGRRAGRPRPLRPQRPRGRERRAHESPARRRRRGSEPAARLLDGHLSQLRCPPGLGLRARSPLRRRRERAWSDRPAVHQRRRRQPRARTLTRRPPCRFPTI